MILAIGDVGVVAAAVKTVCAHLAFGQANAFDKMLYFAELQSGEIEPTGDFFPHILILLGAGG